jgi:ABC-type sugar transport system permease subunit
MNAIDNSILESAVLDGANALQELVYIIMPMIHPTITTLIISNVPAIFTNSGPLFAFYYRSAPTYTMTMGYYLFTETLYGGGEHVYPFLSALGLLLSAVTLPIVYLTKWLFDITDPMKDKEVKQCKKA